ncbi:Heat shock protein. Metallo peptidase. MEROPS family M48B [Gracilibacillus ureilyticus]|uniref:Protease HtpX homolog n=1 Tax=Gracilibacillus ureilyticus TaxID=531814 RepID=A0A1H9VT52_9BACI|nr:protease HtpX [Gracilibacillus ureilyticus]SES24906.1 Heat shock protein. Metallo peptidase. MEROPS family M48B [Gracilibacillus ureilyticus]
MGKRVLLFLLTNILVMTTVAIIWSIISHFTDIGGSYYTGGPGLGIDYITLMVLSIIIGFTGAFISLAMSRMMAKWMMKIKVIDPANPASEQERIVYEKVERLSRAAGLAHTPQVGIYASGEVNAFATGPTKKRSLVAVSQGLLDTMDDDAVEGVIAHEVAHITNGDMVTMTLLQGIINTFVVFLSRIAATIVSRFVRSEIEGIVRFAAIIIFQILFSILGSLVVSAYSRHREYHADKGGAALAGRDKMAHALESLKAYVDRARLNDNTDDSAIQTMKISNKGNAVSLFSSHPPLEERIERLRQS